MEALVVAFAASVALVLIDAGCWIAISLVRWSPGIIVGAITGLLAVREGMAPAEALIMSVLASVIVRHMSRNTQRSNDWNE